MENEETYRVLQEKVEAIAGRKMATPRDFDYLSARIFDGTKTYIAPITLKRFWGYLGEKYRKKPFRSTLDTLATYAGYQDYENLVNSLFNGSDWSCEVQHGHDLQTASLHKGTLIELKWKPDRCVVIKYEGNDKFCIVESKNSKLTVGDTFQCYQFIGHQPLFLRNLVHNNGEPTGYVCGKEGGIKYRIIE